MVNIRTAKVTKDTGILTIEMDGDAEEIERAVKFIEEKGRIGPAHRRANLYRMKISEIGEFGLIERLKAV